MQYKFGAMPPKKDFRDYKLRISKAKKYPEFYTLEPPIISNQGNVNSCVANSVSYIIENFNKKQENNNDLFSRGFLYGYRPLWYYQGEGMYLRECLKTAKNLGNVPVKVFDGGDKEIPEIKNEVMASLDKLEPEANPNRISEYFKLENSSAIKDAIMSYGYVMVSMPWYSDAKVINGILTSYRGEILGNHAVTIFGWKSEGWLFANSWGKAWGNSGCAILPYDYLLREAWGVSDFITSKQAVKKPTNKLLQWFLNLFNKIANRKNPK